MWPEINAESPDLFVWTGDVIYGDTSDMNVLKQKYDIQKNRPEYQKLISNVPVLGIWDDHDYGVNDGGKHFKQKRESKEVFLDFLDYPIDHPVRAHEGMYHNEIIGEGENTINLIFLDTRYFRDTLAADTLTGHRYLINPDGDILGNAQWNWLEEVLLVD